MTYFCITDTLFSRNFRFYSAGSDNTKINTIAEDSNLVRNKHEQESIMKNCALVVKLAWDICCMTWWSHWAELSPEVIPGCTFTWVRSSVLSTAWLCMFCGPVLEIPLLSCPTNFINFLYNSQSFCCVFFKLSSLARWPHAQPFNSCCKLGLRWAARILTH